MRITSLRPVPRRPGFLAVEVDGSRLAVLPVERVHALRLERGAELSVAESRTLELAGTVEDAHRAALRLLAVRGRSSQDMVRRLRLKGYAPTVVEEAVGRLESAGLLDDSAFARHYARARAERGFGRARILADLARRGVERLVAERAVDQAMDDGHDTPLEVVERLARERARRLAHLPPEVRLRRIVGYLSRRGLGGGDVVRLVRSVLAEE